MLLTYKPRAGTFQEEASYSDADFLLTGGQAGPGKTWWLVYNALFDVTGEKTVNLFEHPKYCGILVRREMTQTEQIRRDATPLYGAFGGEWRGQPHNCYTWSSGAKIYVRHMQNLDDWLQFQGWEIHYFGVDEITQFEECQMSGILPWIRSTIHGIRPRFAGTCNPEGIGLDWVKRWWKIKCPCPEHGGVNEPFNDEITIGSKTTKLKYHFIPGKREGSYIEEMAPDYEAKLAIQCGGEESPKFKALGKGCWEVGKGTFFSEFIEGLHTIPDDYQFGGKWNWVFIGGHDFASSPNGDAAAFVLLRVSDKRDVVVENEWYGWGFGVIEQAERFWPLYGVVDKAYSGQDIFASDQGGELKSIADQFRIDCEKNAEFKKQVNFFEAGKDLQTSASLIRSALNASLSNREGSLYIRKRCKRLIGDFKTMQTDSKNFDKWDEKHRITLDGKRYHFDVFNAFRSGFSGVYSSDPLPEAKEELTEKRRENIKKQSEQNVKMSCSYSL